MDKLHKNFLKLHSSMQPLHNSMKIVKDKLTTSDTKVKNLGIVKLENNFFVEKNNSCNSGNCDSNVVLSHVTSGERQVEVDKSDSVDKSLLNLDDIEKSLDLKEREQVCSDAVRQIEGELVANSQSSENKFYDLIDSDKFLGDGKNAFDLEVLVEHMLQDDDIVEKFVFSNKAIVDRIVNDYIARIQSNKVPSALGAKNSTIALTPFKRPKNFSEAKKIVDEYFDL